VPPATVADVVLWRTLAHDAAEQSWKSTNPLSVGSGLTNVAFNAELATRAAAAGALSVGAPGGAVSTTKLRVVGQPETLAAESVAWTRQ
jgi:hypothetical protein